MTNFRLYLNNLLGRSQIYERRQFTDNLIELLAPHYSAEGWKELLKKADEMTAVLYPPPPTKPLTAGETYKISLLPKGERSKAANA